MKNEEKALKLYNGITNVGEDLIEEAGTARKRRKIPAWRGVAVAACLCLALVGTAAAVRFTGVWVAESTRGDMSGIEMGGGVAYLPVDTLSDEIRALEGENTIKKFQSWGGIEDFIGMDLMNNPMLNTSPNYNFYRFRQSGLRGNFFVRVSGSLDCMDALGAYQVGNTSISIRAFLFTERIEDLKEWQDWNEQFFCIYFSDKSEIELETEAYTTPNGLVARIVRVGRADKYNTYMAAFSLNGIPFVVAARGGQNLDATRDVLIQILDGFDL